MDPVPSGIFTDLNVILRFKLTQKRAVFCDVKLWRRISGCKYTFDVVSGVSSAETKQLYGVGAAPRVLICRKFEQNFNKFGQRSFDIFEQY